MNFKLPVLLLFILVFGLSSCKKEDTKDFVKQAKIATEYIKAEDNMADMFVLCHKALHDTTLVNTGEATIDSAMVLYTQDVVSAGSQFTFDFGNTGISCPDGKLRKGQITAVLNHPFDQPDALFTATFTNYMADSLLMQGQFSYLNTGETVAGQLKYEIGFEVSFLMEQNKTLTITAQRDIFWKSGYDKPYKPVNHVFVMPGAASAQYFGFDGSDTPLTTLTTTITTDWVIQVSCFNPIKQGAFEISLNDNLITEILTGEFIDVDENGCADKIIFKNTDNTFGFPYYF